MQPVAFDGLDADLRQAYAEVDWSRTPVGDPATWPPALRHAHDICLHTSFPATLLWGPEYVLIYNEAYAELIGDKHPAALGSRTEDVFPEAWETVGPLLEDVMTRDGPVFLDDTLMPLHRQGFLEECFFSFCYSPVHDEDGTPVGVLDITAETTARVIAGRRLARVAALRGALGDVESAVELCAVVHTVLAEDADLVDVALRLADQPVTDELPRTLPDDPLVPGRVFIDDGADGAVAWLRLRASASAVLSPSGGPRPETPLLIARLNPRLAVDTAYGEYVSLLGTTLAQAWDRLEVLGLERQIAATEHEVSLTLQRSLLPRPATVPGVEVAVRYMPASVHTQVGGDWYDAFLSDAEDLVISVGDVSGHDLRAVSVMGQVRTLLRGLAFRSTDDPGTVMTLLDDVLVGLHLDTLASGILGRVSKPRPDGSRELTWSNAGHPAPVYVGPDGDAGLLAAKPEVLLGLAGLSGVQHGRSTHTAVLSPGSTLVLYTDGLVERSGRHLDRGLEWLCEVAAAASGSGAEELATRLVADLPPTLADDVAVMVVTVC
ncbi:SpoIIE family protein phosphatase [Nocardioidaceae bacterium]|nr:SpoIIE family protein phosphatase [Nocardioidaceae bacterium]